ncbi:MAG: carbohydrate esterase, sialic acid-specific acetylesterase [Ignavibacteria bacterium]|nr:carbohydrate esterase, sialic acid-specific acetylesterase [Ignavibacteria bacterium]
MRIIFFVILALILININIFAQWKKLDTQMGNFYGGYSQVLIDEKNPQIMCVNNSYNYLIISTDNGNNWSKIRISSGYPPYGMLIKDKCIYLTTQEGVFITSDLGKNLIQSYKELKNLYITDEFPIAIKDSILYIGSEFLGLQFSSDKGLSWNEIQPSMKGNDYEFYGLTLIEDSIILVGSKRGLLKSTDSGHSWVLKDFLAKARVINCFNNNFKLLAQCGPISSELGADIYLSTNKGDSWSSISNLGSKTSLITSCGDNLFLVKGHTQVVMSSDMGKSWSSINDNTIDSLVKIPNQPYKTPLLNVSANQDYIFLSTWYGIFRAPLKDCMIDTSSTAVAVAEPPPPFSISPNPAGESITIRHGLQSGVVAIYNLLGEKVFDSKIEGENPLNIDVSEWRSGVYLCVVRGGSGIITEKVVIAR